MSFSKTALMLMTSAVALAPFGEAQMNPSPNDPLLEIQEAIDGARFSYALEEQQLSERESLDLAAKLFGESGVQLQIQSTDLSSNTLLFRTESDASAILDLDRLTGGFLFNKGFASFQGLGDTPNLPDATVAPDRALSLLSTLNLLPNKSGEMIVDHVGGIDMGLRGEDGSVETFKKIVTVRFGRVLDGMRVEGPGSRIVVRLGENGQLAALVRNWRDATPRMLSAEERFQFAEIHQIARLRLQQIEAETLATTLESAEVVLYDDGLGVIEPAVRVVAKLTLENKAASERRSEGMETFESPLDFYVPLLRKPQARFPFLGKSAKLPAEPK